MNADQLTIKLIESITTKFKDINPQEFGDYFRKDVKDITAMDIRNPR